MASINWIRVLLGGLAAGFVMNCGEFVLNAVIFAKDIEESNRKLNLPPPSGDFIAKAVILVFLVGIVAVLLYAAIRPRFGAGPKTAILAGFMVWFLVFVYGSVLNNAMGIFPLNLTLIGLARALVEAPLATLVGAWVYREEAA